MFWKPAGLLARVVGVCEGLLELHRKDGRQSPATITLQVTLPIPPNAPKVDREFVLPEIIQVVDPGSQEAMNKLAESGRVPQ